MFYKIQKYVLKVIVITILPLFACIVWLLIRICFNEVLSISASVSLILSKQVDKSPSLDVNKRIIVETGPTYLFNSISLPPVVFKDASRKQKAKALLLI